MNLSNQLAAALYALYLNTDCVCGSLRSLHDDLRYRGSAIAVESRRRVFPLGQGGIEQHIKQVQFPENQPSFTADDARIIHLKEVEKQAGATHARVMELLRRGGAFPLDTAVLPTSHATIRPSLVLHSRVRSISLRYNHAFLLLPGTPIIFSKRKPAIGDRLEADSQYLKETHATLIAVLETNVARHFQELEAAGKLGKSKTTVPKPDGYTAAEMRSVAINDGDATCSMTKFRDIRSIAGLKARDQYRRFSNANIRSLAKAAREGGTLSGKRRRFSDGTKISKAWLDLIGDNQAAT